MKTILFLVFWSGWLISLGQSYGIKSIPKMEADSISYKINRGFNVGVSLGVNRVFDKLYEATISPVDNKLSLNRLQRSAFVMSTVIAVPLSKGELGGSYARRLDGQGKAYGPVYYVPYGLYLIAAVNLTTFHDAMKGGVFNQKIDGGLGLGYRLNHDLQIALTFEKISVRQPRDFLFEPSHYSQRTTADHPQHRRYRLFQDRLFECALAQVCLYPQRAQAFQRLVSFLFSHNQPIQISQHYAILI